MFGINIDPSQFNLQQTLIAILAFIVLVGLMVLVHEAGHFLVAKACRVRVEAFSFGFGPRLFGFKYGDTDYRICALPLGGYVKMTGENPGEEPQADDPGAFMAHPRWQRMLIALAGPTSNFLLAFALMFAYFAWINEVPLDAPRLTTVEWVIPGSPAAQAGLQPGDVIRRMQGAVDPDLQQVAQKAVGGQNQTIPLTIERAGSRFDVALFIPEAGKTPDEVPNIAGIIPQLRTNPIHVDEAIAGAPAERAGLRTGDLIVSVDGYRFDRLEPLLYYLDAGQGKPITLNVMRNGIPIAPIVVHPERSQDAAAFPWKIGFRGRPIEGPTRNEPLPLGVALERSKLFCQDNSTLIVRILGKLFTHQVSVRQLSGPIGIAAVAGQAAESKGWVEKFELAGSISLNLGILNLLPFPILDGGMILFLLIESLIRRDLPMALKERIYQGAFVLILLFFAFIMVSDFSKLPIFTHVKP